MTHTKISEMVGGCPPMEDGDMKVVNVGEVWLFGVPYTSHGVEVESGALRIGRVEYVTDLVVGVRGWQQGGLWHDRSVWNDEVLYYVRDKLNFVELMINPPIYVPPVDREGQPDPAFDHQP